jgi:hypothetical protein
MEEDEAEDQELFPKITTIQTLQSPLCGSNADEAIPKPIVDTLEFTPHTIESPEDSMILERNY